MRLTLAVLQYGDVRMNIRTKVNGKTHVFVRPPAGDLGLSVHTQRSLLTRYRD